MELIGSFCFGLVIGWITYRTIRRKEGAAISDIASVIGAVGGAAVTTLFGSKEIFGTYCIGLAVGFFLYLIVAYNMGGKGETLGWMKTDDKPPV